IQKAHSENHSMITVYIALGTNAGEREANLLQALRLLPESGVHIRRVSSINETIDTPELQVPHPRMLERKFVLIPLAEIAPNLRQPSWKSGVAHLLAASADHSAVKKFHDAPSF